MNHASETPFYFDHADARLFAVLYEPSVEGSGPRGRGVLCCAPFAEEAAVSQKVCVEFARVLARRGYHVLRFDYRGCGESSGEFDEVTPDSHLADIRAALGWLRRNAGVRVGLLGLRLGASLAAMVAAADPAVESLVLWEPVACMSDHFKNLLRAQVVAGSLLAGRVVETRKDLLDQLNSGRTVDILGYPITPQCMRGFQESDFLGLAGRAHSPTLVVGIGRHRRPRKDLQTVVEACERGGQAVEFHQVQEQPFWIEPDDPWRELASWQGHEHLFRLSADWLDEVGKRR